jgi:hypothetical protein
MVGAKRMREQSGRILRRFWRKSKIVGRSVGEKGIYQGGKLIGLIPRVGRNEYDLCRH